LRGESRSKQVERLCLPVRLIWSGVRGLVMLSTVRRQRYLRATDSAGFAGWLHAHTVASGPSDTTDRTPS
jgi:hypothetical protein